MNGQCWARHFVMPLSCFEFRMSKLQMTEDDSILLCCRILYFMTAAEALLSARFSRFHNPDPTPLFKFTSSCWKSRNTSLVQITGSLLALYHEVSVAEVLRCWNSPITTWVSQEVVNFLKFRLVVHILFTIPDSHSRFVQILVAVCLAAFISGHTIPPVPTDDIDESIYGMIESILREMFPEDEDKVLCMAEDIKMNKIVDRFFTKELLDDRDALQKEVQVYSPNAEANCKLGSPSQQTESTEVFHANKPGAPSKSSCGKSGSHTYWPIFIGATICVISTLHFH